MILSQKKHNNEQGLTLIELVIAMALFAMIASTAYSGLMQILRASKALDDERDTSMIANAVLSRIIKELQLTTPTASLLPPADNSSQTYSNNTHLIGESKSIRGGLSGDTITFVANEAGQYVPDGQTHTGVVQITYRVEPAPADEVRPGEEEVYYLIRDEVPLIRPVSKAYKKRMTFPISKHLMELKFRYYDKENQSWSSDWDHSQGKLPSIVHFVLKVRSPAGKVHVYASDVALNLF